MKGLTFLGLVSLVDPPKPGVPDAVSAHTARREERETGRRNEGERRTDRHTTGRGEVCRLSWGKAGG